MVSEGRTNSFFCILTQLIVNNRDSPVSTFYLNPYALISFSSFLIMLMLGFLLRYKYYSAQTRYVSLIFLVTAIYSFFYTFEISQTDPGEIVWFYRLEYFGISFLAPCFVMFALQFSGRGRWLSPGNKLLIFTIPVITLVMVFTNDYHHFFYSDAKMNTDGPFPSFGFKPAAWYYIHQGYVIVTMLFSLFLLARMLKNAVSIYRKQILLLLLATLFPFLGYLVYQLKIVPYGIDPVSFTFTLTGITIYLALSRFKLFDLEPIARTLLFEKIQDGVLVFDQHNRLVDYNHTMGRKLNLSREDLGKTTEELSDRWPRLMKFAEKQNNGKLELSQELEGRRYHYDVQLMELINSEQIRQGKLLVIRDISDLINKEIERKSTASKLDAVIQAMPDMLFVIDRKGVFTDFFVSESDNLFLNRDEVLGASINDLFNQEEAEVLHNKLDECFASDQMRTYQYEMNFPGTLKYYEARICRLDSDNALVIVRDVSESHEMKKDLLYLSGFQNILMSLAPGFIHIAPEEADDVISDSLQQVGRYLEVERCSIFRYDLEQKTMTNTHEWCSKDIASRFSLRQNLPVSLIDHWTDSHLRGEPSMVENIRMLPKEDKIRQLLETMGVKSVIAIPMMSRDNCLGYVGFETQKENRKWSGAEISLLKIYTGMLASMLEKITIEKSLSEARIRAEAGNRLKTAFMNNISHEIRTPLNGIIGFGEIIANEHLTMDEKNKFLSVVQESSERLMQTIDDYLDISLLVTGNQEVNPVTFNVSQLIEKIVSEHAYSNGRHSVDVVSEIPEELTGLTLHSDYDLIRKVFNHLMGNSLKFTTKGSVRVGMGTEDGQLLLYVQDTGIGIAPDAQKFVFDSFMQEDFSSTRTYQGSGLGLAIVKGIVTLLDGSITMTSVKGKGTTFLMRFPLKQG